MRMKRGIIYNNDYSIIIPNDEIWMTSWEIADLFYVTPVSINHAIKRILKKEVLVASQVHRYICLENGNHADVYNMEMVIALSFHFDTGHSILFRRWLIQKASTPYRTQIPILVHLPGKDVCSCWCENLMKPDLVKPFRAFSCPFQKIIAYYVPTMQFFFLQIQTFAHGLAQQNHLRGSLCLS